MATTSAGDTDTKQTKKGLWNVLNVDSQFPYVSRGGNKMYSIEGMGRDGR
jgi:hypothetical protein